jgi:hypothetical protein
MSYTEFALQLIAAAIIFALIAIVARRAATTQRAIIYAIVAGFVVTLGFGAAIGFLRHVLPLGQIDFVIVRWLVRLGLLKG